MTDWSFLNPVPRCFAASSLISRAIYGATAPGGMALCLLALSLPSGGVCADPPPQFAGALGADVNADVDAFGHSQMDSAALRDFAAKNTVLALPLFNLPPGDSAGYWDSMAEQYEAAQIDFVAVWLKGNGQPATFARLVAALRRRGLTNRVKIMPFDDNPASWTALWNFQHGDGYGYKKPFDLGDPAARAFVWDGNVKAFFAAVPDADRYKIDGRPVYAVWSGSPAFLAHLDGSGSKLLGELRAGCRRTFGFNPYILVSEDWVKNDPSSAAPGVVDGVYPWFTPVPGPNYSTWNVHTQGGKTFGTCIPSFHISNTADPNAPLWIVDPAHGQTLAAGLAGTVGSGRCASTFVEGFDDYWENATVWRARNLDEGGRPLGYAETGYDYPNQRINIVRRYSRNPFPALLKEEAESCDTFSGAAADPSKPNFYRNGPVAIEDATDTGGGWDVCRAQAGETLTWQDVPLEGMPGIFKLARHRRQAAGCTLSWMAGRTPPFVSPKLPGRHGQQWISAHTRSPYGSTHTVSLVWDTPGVRVNWWQAKMQTFPDGIYQIVPRQQDASGLLLSRRTWRLHALGSGVYALQSGKVSLRRAITVRADGFLAIGTDPQEWSLRPAPSL